MILINGNKTYAGCTFKDWEHNTLEDSDFYAESINPETGKVEVVNYNSTRYAGGGDCEIDMTQENLQKYLHNAKARHIAEAVERYRRSADVVGKGKEVVVVKGRKVPKGTTGTIFWQKEVNYDRYGRWYNSQTKIGIKDSEGNVYWTYAHNVEVANPAKYIPSIGSIRKEVAKARSEAYKTMQVLY